MKFYKNITDLGVDFLTLNRIYVGILPEFNETLTYILEDDGLWGINYLEYFEEIF
jgi:hypothetical protein